MPTDELINVDDFRRIELKIDLNNTTTSTHLKSGKLTYSEGHSQLDSGSSKDADMKIQVEEFLDQGIVIEIPARLCAEGHTLLLEITPKNAKGYEDFVFWASGTVSAKEQINKERDRVEINFQEYKKSDYTYLKSIFLKRQEEILDFFKAAKGY